MNKTQTYDSFECCENTDLALPGDPWSHLRYHYGQLLGAEDLTAEQRAFVLRHRLHLALLHGCGTVWGLKVDNQEEDPGRLYVEAGLAVDVVGREIFVNEKQCLDIAGLHATEFWTTLQTLPNEDDTATGDIDGDETATGAGPVLDADTGSLAEGPDKRRAYVVLCYEACLSQRVPAITPPCGDADDAFAFGRINDRFRIDLVAEPPPDPHDLHRQWLPAEGQTNRLDEWATLRDRLLDHQLNCFIDAPDLTRFWNRLEKAPLLLASVDLIHEPGITAEDDLTIIDALDNRGRALLPAVQLVAEQVLGHRLIGNDSRKPLKLLSLEDNAADVDDTVNPTITLTLSEQAAEKTVNKDAIKVYRLENNDEWSGQVTFSLSSTTESVIKLIVSDIPPWPKGTVYQVHILGAGRKPIVTGDGRPLSGWWDEPTPPKGRGRDISIIRTWNPASATS